MTFNSSKSRVKAIDLFCGAGGSSIGAKQAGVDIVACFDLWDKATATFLDNFPDAKVFTGKLEDHDPANLVRQLPKIDLILASPECTNHTCAKGKGKLLDIAELSRATAFQVIRFVKAFDPRWLVIENVVHRKKWVRYGEFCRALRNLGYNVLEQTLDASDFGVAQSRRRLFLLCDKSRPPSRVDPTHSKKVHVRDFLDTNGTYRFSPLVTPRRALPTLQRADRAMAAIGRDKRFLLVYYGSDAAGGWQTLNRPLRTVTTVDRFAYVKPTSAGHMMRMLQVDELKKAMGFPQSFKMHHGTRRDKIKLLGNAVCPPVMTAIIRGLTHVSVGTPIFSHSS